MLIDATAAHRYSPAPTSTTAASESATTRRTAKARPPPAVAASVPAVGERELAMTRRSASTTRGRAADRPERTKRLTAVTHRAET